MKRILTAVLFCLASPVMALEAGPSKALHVFTECLPTADVSCALTSCTQSQVCALCTKVKETSAAVCTDKVYAYAALEGLTGKIEGYCHEVCKVGSPIGAVRAKGEFDAGDSVFVVNNSSDGHSGLGIVISKGQAHFADISYSGPRKTPASELALTSESVSAPIANSVACLKTKGNSLFKSCLSNTGKCSGKKALSGSGKCGVCKSVSSCEGYSDFLSAMFDIDCKGC